jgi:hypothetical protein
VGQDEHYCKSTIFTELGYAEYFLHLRSKPFSILTDHSILDIPQDELHLKDLWTLKGKTIYHTVEVRRKKTFNAVSGSAAFREGRLVAEMAIVFGRD